MTSCECERSSGATLAQVLLLANSDEIENKLAAGEGRIARLLADKKPMKDAVDELYLATLVRYPRADELATALPYVDEAKDKAQALQDLLWTLLNSREFMFNH